MPSKQVRNTYSLLFHFVVFFLFVSLILRISLMISSFSQAQLDFTSIVRIIGMGFIYDLGVAVFFAIPYALFLQLLPSRWNNSLVNKFITYTSFFIVLLILMFSFFAEITFWQEFESRFNFIAVDYLIYTYEVVKNINESYPLPWLISGMVLLALLVLVIFHRRGYFKDSFQGDFKWYQRLVISIGLIITGILYVLFISNQMAETDRNRYRNELAKAGIYSFFAAYKNNELNYDHFYKLIDNDLAFKTIRASLADSGTGYLQEGLSIRRSVRADGLMKKPNVIMIVLESFSADFMSHFGNNKGLTPVLDSIWDQSIVFTDIYATGTRTVRGMEALSLAIPPTPGSSIVRRPDNNDLTTIGNLFKKNGYETGFFYGGDGYFDNMNMYFGNNGYSVTDRPRSGITRDRFRAPRFPIPDSMVHFENAWGVSDEDIYQTVIRDADSKYKNNIPFYDFVMTTSNHRPFTYPPGKIDIPSGTGRDGAVKYTDYAIGRFLNDIKTKPWYDNTVFIIVADHCASSAGKNEIDIAKYHIPALIFNLDNKPPFSITKMCSQIDIYPTLFYLLNWNYTSDFYGKNVLSEKFRERAYFGTYQKLAYLESDSLVILSPQQQVETYLYNKKANEQVRFNLSDSLVNRASSAYQTAFYLFKNHGLKQ